MIALVMTQEEMTKVIMEIQEVILQKLDINSSISDQTILSLIEESVLRFAHTVYLSMDEKKEVIQRTFYAIRKLDVLQEILEDQEITEIMVNGPDQIFIEKQGRLEPYPKKFLSKEKLEDVIQQIVGKVNRTVNESSPIVDVRLQDGSRVNVVLPPVAINGPIVTIRKFPADPITMEHLVSIQSITMQAAEFLKKLVQAKYNIFISGGTGSGKTTFLNALSAYIPKEERIITIEDSAELQIQNIPNLVRLEVRNANLEGKNEVTIRDLIRSALRMRPDRIILGEVRDAAAYDLLSVMNTGHDGSLSTGHANSPKDMLKRLEALVLTAVDIPLLAVRSQIASAIDIVVQLGRLRDRSRKVLEIDEMIGMDGTEIIMRPLYCFKEQGEDEKGNVIGQLAATQNALYHTQKLKAAGMELPELSDGHQAEKGDDYAER
ncbi:type II secretion system protein E [Clostridium sp. CAG:230]|nr:type II secretion system protein E [Clostridium sp. CAG:230]